MQEGRRCPGSCSGPGWSRRDRRCWTSPLAAAVTRCSLPSATTRFWRSTATPVGSPWPLFRRFGAVIVTNYLHRPLMPALLDAVEPGGVLLYQTFMEGNERFGRPTNPAHLLHDGELLELVRGRFSVTAYEARLISDPDLRMSMVQRVAARRL